MSNLDYESQMKEALESCELASTLSNEFRATVRLITVLRMKECQGDTTAMAGLALIATKMPEAVENARSLNESDSKYAMISMAVGELLSYEESFHTTPSVRQLVARAFNLALPESN